MPRTIASFTDFGTQGPYLGQMRLAIGEIAPDVQVVDLMNDAPAFDPAASACLLAALAPYAPEGTVFLAVVDPGVGSARVPMVLEADQYFFVGPDNGLFEHLMRHAKAWRTFEIVWKPERLSSTFHGRDLFAPVAARLATGASPEEAGCRPAPPTRRPDWPDDPAQIVYVDAFGNCWTGMRAAAVPDGSAPLGLPFARTYAEAVPGSAFWYENSCGLAEIAVNGGSAAKALNLAPGKAAPLYTLVAK